MLHIPLSILGTVKFIVTALSLVRTGVGDILPIFLPPYIVALLLHQVAELLLAFGLLHDLVYDIYQLPLEALAALS